MIENCEQYGQNMLFVGAIDRWYPALNAPVRAAAEAPPGGDAAGEIFRANCELIEQADVGLCNLSPFRGPSADVGTAFELGFLFASGKPVYGYSSDESPYLDRVARELGPLMRRDGRSWDRDGLQVEEFGLADNLMLAKAIEERSVEMIAIQETGSEALAAFAAFEACLDLLKSRT